jgi:hypothetical protein
VRLLELKVAGEHISYVVGELGLDALVLDIGDQRIASVVMVILHSERRHATVGFGCDEDIGAATAKAVFEALMLRKTAAAYVANHGSVNPDEIWDSVDHLGWAWMNSDKILSWYESLIARTAESDQRAKSFVADLRLTLSQRVSTVFGSEPLIADITDEASRHGSYYVVRAIVRGMARKEYSHKYRYRGGHRFRSCESLNELPHPIG